MYGNYLVRLKTLFSKINHGIVRSAFSLGTSSVITQFMMMLYLVIVAKWLGAGNYSYIAVAYAIASMTSFIFNWGLNEWMMKHGPISDSPDHLGGGVIFFKFLTGIFWGAGLFFILQYLNPGLYLANILLLILLDVWIDSMFGSLLVILVLKSQTGLASVLLISSRTIRLISVVIIILVGFKTIFLVSMVRLLCTLLTFGTTWLWTRPIFNENGLLTSWHIFRDSSTFNISEVLNLIYLHTDVNLLSFLGTDRVLIANYSVVIGLINALMVFPLSVYTVLLGSLVRTYQKNAPQFIRQIRFVYGGFTITGILIWLGVLYLGIPVIRLFLGEGYQPSGEILKMLSPILVFKTINQANITYLVAVGWQAKRLGPQTGVVLLKVLIGVWAISKWQIVGLVAVAVNAELVMLGGHFYQVARHYFSNRKLIYQ